jgi:hypothetical protein
MRKHGIETSRGLGKKGEGNQRNITLYRYRDLPEEIQKAA